MLVRTSILAACVLLAASVWPQRVFAYGYASEIAYSTSSGVLAGFSQTWKDPWDWDYSEYCIEYVWDDVYGFYCYLYQIQINYVAVDASIYSPSSAVPVFNGANVDFSIANAGTALYPSEAGLWATIGTHHVIADIYLMWCPYGFCVPYYSGSYLFYLGQSSDTVYTCAEPTVDIMRQEYVDHSVNWMPNCWHFSNSGGTTHYSWTVLNGQFSNGNPHSPWGIIQSSLANGVEATYTTYNRGYVRMSSGYRCPHGNASIPGAASQSYHMHGRAADLYSDVDQQWTEAEFNLLKAAADQHGPIESFNWNTYADRHFHVAF